ncbi:MAG: hypothetical protein KC449_11525, partial [Anaerolineales bacterium]|nr:hypothetical protein [Anaerolineales bacterium]
VDIISQEIWTLVPKVDNLIHFDLSPNAQQLAFVASGLDGIPDATTSQLAANNLYVLATGGGNANNLRQVYACQLVCLRPTWHIESNLVAFADGDGLWLYNIAANAPDQLLENQLPVLEGPSADPGLFYTPIAWANNGRYLLLQRSTFNNSTHTVLDVPTGTLAAEVDALVDVYPPPTEVSWMLDDRLFVVRTQLEPKPITPIAEIWRFNLDAGQLILEESTPLSGQPMTATGATYLEDGRFAFALDISPSTFNEPPAVQAAIGTYLLTSLIITPKRVNSLPLVNTPPFSRTMIFWTKDGSGALLQNDSSIYYAPTNGDFLYEVTAVFGQNPHAFQWQPEIIVP